MADLTVIVGLDYSEERSRWELPVNPDTLTTRKTTIDILGDIVAEALDANMEDQTIEDEDVDDLVELVMYLERRAK